jgi:serine/threonine protein phosphatase PrpC
MKNALTEVKMTVGRNSDCNNSGATSIIAMTHGRHLVLSCLGNCKAYIVDNMGHSRSISIEHFPSNREESFRIQSLGGVVQVNENDPNDWSPKF